MHGSSHHPPTRDVALNCDIEPLIVIGPPEPQAPDSADTTYGCHVAQF